jgi:two-component system, OmpR family, sensor kinase
MPDDLPPPIDSSGAFFREVDTQILVHDLKSPLALIEATTRTLLEQTARLGPVTERQDRALRRILRGAIRGRRTVEHLLEIGRAESSQFVDCSFDAGEAVLQVLFDSAESSDGDLAGRLGEAPDDDEKRAALARVGIVLRVEASIAGTSMFQDRVKFDLIVSNVIQNGLRYRRQRLEIALGGSGDDLTVTVQDDGPGIAPEYHEMVFERYRQGPDDDGLERKGHGLGLAGARILARRLGGEISLESAASAGATFVLTVPRRRPQTEPRSETMRGP